MIIHGSGVGDDILGPDLQFRPFEVALQSVLIDKGYDRIVYSSLSYPLYGYDRMLGSEPGSGGGQRHDADGDNPDRPNAKANEIVGPRGKRSRPSAKPSPAVGSGPAASGSIGHSHAVTMIDSFMRERRPRTAVVVPNADTMLRHWRGEMELAAKIDDWLHSPTDSNCLVLLFRHADLVELERTVDALSWLPRLRTVLDEHVRPGGVRRIAAVGPPGPDEIRRVLHRLRLVGTTADSTDRGVTVESTPQPRLRVESMSQFDRMVAAFAAEPELLTTWRSRLEQMVIDGDALDWTHIRRSGWLSSDVDSSRSAVDRLDDLVGLTAVKKRLQSLATGAATNARLAEANPDSQVEAPLLHLVFSGSPGTGKTTVARLIGEIYRDYGLLRRGHLVEASVDQLVAGFIGQTAIQTSAIVDSAIDGVLLIDEAYQLLDSEFGRSAIDTLVARLENDRHRLAVVFAGYSKQMSTFLTEANPGLERRIPRESRIEFPDYSPEELCDILRMMIDAERIPTSSELDAALLPATEALHRARNDRFGNAGEVRSLLSEMKAAWGARTGINVAEPMTVEDLPHSVQANQTTVDTVEDVMVELNALIGLAPVKTRVASLVNLIRLEQRSSGGTPVHAPHLLFVGPPGTGKTTVAKLMGRILNRLGLLPTDTVHPVTRRDLVGVHIGETAKQTAAEIERAIGGVLFIDEAYSLAASSSRDYGHEALATLLHSMTERAGNLSVIAAGYPGRMAEFLRSNPGLRSRFGDPVAFPHYTDGELLLILRKLAADDNDRRFEADVEAKVRAWIVQRRHRDGPEFGNARTMSQLHQMMKFGLADRLAKSPTSDPTLFVSQDVPDVGA